MANTAGNPLSAGSLALFMASSLPRDVSPQIKNPFDAVALAVHAGMIAVGFRLIGLGEDHKIRTFPQPTIPVAHTHSSQKQAPTPMSLTHCLLSGTPPHPTPSDTLTTSLQWNIL